MRDNIDIDKPEKWLTGTSQVQEGKAQSPVSGEELYQAGTRASWGPPSWAGKLLSGKALEVLESSKVNTSQNMHSSGILSCTECSQQAKGGDPSPLLSTGEHL